MATEMTAASAEEIDAASAASAASAANTWDTILAGPAFLINLERQPSRLAIASRRLAEAGFTDVRTWRAIDGASDDLTAAWERHGSPRFDPTDTWFADLSLGHTHKQGIMLSHMDLYKHMIDTNIPYATIFEDDLVCHKDFAELAPVYYESTPKDYEACFIGHHCGGGAPYHIRRVPVYCLHAYILTQAGARRLYDRLINDPDGLRAIDCLINHYMVQALTRNTPFLNWYVWNAEAFPDATARKHAAHAHKDSGLVFQEDGI